MADEDTEEPEPTTPDGEIQNKDPEPETIEEIAPQEETQPTEDTDQPQATEEGENVDDAPPEETDDHESHVLEENEDAEETVELIVEEPQKLPPKKVEKPKEKDPKKPTKEKEKKQEKKEKPKKEAKEKKEKPKKEGKGKKRKKGKVETVPKEATQKAEEKQTPMEAGEPGAHEMEDFQDEQSSLETASSESLTLSTEKTAAEAALAAVETPDKKKKGDKKRKGKKEKKDKKDKKEKPGKTDKKDKPEKDNKPKKLSKTEAAALLLKNVLEEYHELMDLAIEIGVELPEEIIQQAPKKTSKKQKGKRAAEEADKLRTDLEGQVKILQDLVKKKEEADRQVAIAKQKREIIEQQWRIEQLESSNKITEEIMTYIEQLDLAETKQKEWDVYIECPRLPNPLFCDQMNTYLHLWELNMELSTIDDISQRTEDVIELMKSFTELLDTTGEEDVKSIETYKWLRGKFREHQSEFLDVATYQLLRDVEHNLRRIDIPTADFDFQDDNVTLCVWLRLMLAIPLPNPRRPPKPRIDVTFEPLNMSVLCPLSVDCKNAAIRAMYLKYDFLSDQSPTYTMPKVAELYCEDLYESSKKEWRAKLKYKFDNSIVTQIVTTPNVNNENPEKSENPPKETAENAEDTQVVPEEEEKEIPIVPYKRLKPTASEYFISLEDEFYMETREKLRAQIDEDVINLRKFTVLGGVYYLNLLEQPPQPQNFVTLDMTLTGLYLPKKLKTLPFYVAYIPPPPSDPDKPKTPEDMEEEMRYKEEQLDKLISVSVKWPQHVIFLELPIVCRWDEENNNWTKSELYDVKHNEEKCIVSFRTGVFGIFAMATYRYSNLPFQAYDIKPEADESVTIQLTAAILMLEFNIKNGKICLSQLQNSPNNALQDIVGTYFKLHQLKRMMVEAGIDIFPEFDAFCYVEGSCEKHWAMEKQLYNNIAQMANSFNFSWSRWNLQAGRRNIVLQMRLYEPTKPKQKNHQMLLVTPLKAAFVDCTEVSQVFSEVEIDTPRFSADLINLMRITSSISVRAQVAKADKQTVYTLLCFLNSTRILSFS